LHQKVVMFGDHSGPAQPGQETWIYDPCALQWTNVSPNPSPPPRGHFGMAYDADHDRVIIFAGGSGNYPAPPKDTWAYDVQNNVWMQKNPAQHPPNGGRMIFDAKHHLLFLFDTVAHQTWTYDSGSDVWTQVVDATPEPPAYGAMAFDDVSGVILSYGG